MKRKLGVVLSGCGWFAAAAISAGVPTVASPAGSVAGAAEAAR